MDFSPDIIPLRPVGTTASCSGFASRPVHSVFILSPFSFVFAPYRYNHIIPKRQNNASGVCGFAYKVIYIKRRFSCVVFTKTACAIGCFLVKFSQILKTHKLFFSQPFCTSFVLDCTNSRFYLLFTLTKKQSGYYRMFGYYNVPVK